MKRKRNSEYEAIKKRKKTSLGYTLANENKVKDRSIYDYWSSDKANPKNKSMPNHNQDILNSFNPKFNLVKNPSKQHLVSGSVNLKVNDYSLNNNYKKIILIDEDLVESLNKLLSPFLTEISKIIKTNSQLVNDYHLNSVDKFIERNSSSICAKFILQKSKYFLFIPKSFTSKDYDKNKLPLLESFNDSRHINLQYHPFNCHEVLNINFSSSLVKYLKEFNRKMKLGHSQRALVLYDPSEKWIDRIKEIESICNSNDYKIIRIDELESHKNKQLQKISEATKSQRLSSLPDSISERLRMLERIVNNDHKRLNAFLNKTSLPCESDSFSISTNASDTITHYFSKDTKERSIYNIVEDNVFQICAKKKTLILIVDSFISTDGNKTYLNNIISKISDTKCPIAILTNNLNFAKADNFFNNSLKTITSTFLFYHIDDYNWKFYIKALCSLSVIIFLHVYVEEILDEFLNAEYNDGDIGYKISKKFERLLDEQFLKACVKNNVFPRIVEYSQNLLQTFNCNMNEIMFHLKDKLKCIHAFKKDFKVHEDNFSLLMLNKIESICQQGEDEIKVDDCLKELSKNFEFYSFEDYCSTKLCLLGEKSFKKFHYDISYSIKRNDNKLSLIPEDFVNCENILMKNYLQVPNEQSRTRSLTAKYTKDIKTILNEDLAFYRNFMLNKISNVTVRNCYEYNFLFSSINKLSEEEFSNFFHIKKQRSLDKLYTLRDRTNQINQIRKQAMSKIFRGANLKLIERHLHSHSLEVHKPKRYYSDYKIYEVLENNNDSHRCFIREELEDSICTEDNKELN